MGSRKTKKELIGIWRSVHLVIWILGFYILFSRGVFFPGILVLLALSAIYEALLQRFVPGAYEVVTGENESSSVTDTISPAASINASTPVVEHRLELLPQVCPSCNAPIRGHEVRWTGPQSADCPYCGTNLPMSQA